MSAGVSSDVIIIGAGLAGSLSAAVLSRAGYHVALIDARADAPDEFRAEKMGLEQLALFEKLGLADIALAHTTPHDRVLIARFGRVVAEGVQREFGFKYSHLVNGLRQALPCTVEKIVGRVARIETSDDRQRVTLSDGRVLDARLVVVATGLGEAARAMLGVERVVARRAHSLSIGFSFEAPPEAYSYDSLIYFGSGAGNRISYITIFRMGAEMRANLFVYRSATEAWTRQFREQPGAAMQASMPRLAALAGDLAVKGTVAVRPIDLATSINHRQAGVVLIGDAFATCCPIIGMGVMKVLTDVERLCLAHIPLWLATPGMSTEKISTFYDDATKTACDTKAHDMSLYSRSIVVDQGLVWRARRLRNDTARRGVYALKGVKRALVDAAHRPPMSPVVAPVVHHPS